ncbi:CD36 family protein [Ancylostoma duodenale]|uniref:CD36 family protein n=1 Tax=Ancylostoma duodenale TaxID=51022 RepID=A0A0C2CTG2_9BILA|nr:CD36 family protein [Ancylostoma duodenale]
MTKSWLRPAYYMEQQIWMYHVENVAEIIRGAKPKLNEVGPFTFMWKLVDFASQGFLQKLAITAILTATGEKPFINVTVQEALFDGYHDPVIDAVCEKPILSMLCDALKIPQRIGFLYGQNNTDDGLYEVSTGLGAPWNIGKGFLDISRCLPGAPRIYISQPHFLNAPREVLYSVEGMRSPNEKDDATFVEIEPTSGVPVRAKRRVQINVGITNGDLNILSAMKNIICPTLWMNETVRFDDGTKAQLDQLLFAKHLAYIVGVSFLTVGLLIFFVTVVTVVIYTVLKPRMEDEQPILQEESVEEEVDTMIPSKDERDFVPGALGFCCS